MENLTCNYCNFPPRELAYLLFDVLHPSFSKEPCFGFFPIFDFYSKVWDVARLLGLRKVFLSPFMESKSNN